MNLAYQRKEEASPVSNFDNSDEVNDAFVRSDRADTQNQYSRTSPASHFLCEARSGTATLEVGNVGNRIESQLWEPFRILTASAGHQERRTTGRICAEIRLHCRSRMRQQARVKENPGPRDGVVTSQGRQVATLLSHEVQIEMETQIDLF
jgi:hypothetical protein